MTTVKSWIKAARLRTLPLAFASILVGSAIAFQEGDFKFSVAVLTLLTAVLLQVLSNFANDYGDAVSGVDSSDRKGPDRMVQSGAISRKSMRNALIVTATLTFFSGTFLLYIAFPGDWQRALIFLSIGLAAIVAAIKYTVGKNPYGYAGFGDLFVFVFFGIVAVAGTFFLQTGRLDLQVLLPASSLGLFAIGVLNVNNIRDIDSDKEAGKYSIPVRIGKKNAVIYHAILLQLGMILSIVYSFLNFNTWWNFIFVLANILLILNIKAVSTKPSSELDPYLKQMALSTLLFSLLFTLGLLAG